MPRAWSIISLAANRQYGGNEGYSDEPRRIYRCDSNVANYKQVTKEDFVVVRDNELLLALLG